MNFIHLESLRMQGTTGSDAFYAKPPLSNWEQVEMQCSVTVSAPHCALKNHSNNLVCQRGTPALLFPAICEAPAIPAAASRPLLGQELFQRQKFVYINKYLCV